MTTITPRLLHDRLQQGEKFHLIDVSTPAEHAEVHVPGVLLAPLDRLDERLASENGCTKDQPIVFFCRTGFTSFAETSRRSESNGAMCHS